MSEDVEVVYQQQAEQVEPEGDLISARRHQIDQNVRDDPRAYAVSRLKVNEVENVVPKAGSDSVKSSKLMFCIAGIIKSPMRISAGAVASAGIMVATGVKKSMARNRTAVVAAVRPVRPPSSTSAADSMKS